MDKINPIDSVYFLKCAINAITFYKCDAELWFEIPGRATAATLSLTSKTNLLFWLQRTVRWFTGQDQTYLYLLSMGNYRWEVTTGIRQVVGQVH